MSDMEDVEDSVGEHHRPRDVSDPLPQRGAGRDFARESGWGRTRRYGSRQAM
jgi:hypothetical protein